MIALVRPEFGTEEIEAVERGSGRAGWSKDLRLPRSRRSSRRSWPAAPVLRLTPGRRLCILHLSPQESEPATRSSCLSFTFAATANAVRLSGATPVFADIEPQTFNLDPSATAAAVTSRTAALMPVHLFGHPAQMTEMRQIADRHKLLLMEDAAQAHAASLDDVPAGALGDVAAFSFYATKNMTTGEGGMVVLRDEAAARTVRLLRNQGMEKQYLNEVVGYNMRMTDLAAAIGRVQLRKLDEMNRSRRLRGRRGLRQGVRRTRP